MATLEEVRRQHPTARYAPHETCPYCQGTGSVDADPCDCLYFETADVVELARAARLTFVPTARHILERLGERPKGTTRKRKG